MGSWDELCILCGVAPSGGCSKLLPKSAMEEQARKIAEEIKPGDEETLKIVLDALDASFSPQEKMLGFRHSWLPEGVGREQYNPRGCIAVGYFGQDGECEVRDGKVPDGRRVEVRRVQNPSGHDFSEVIRVVDGWEKTVDESSVCSAKRMDNPNFALCEPCYRYLEAWLDRDNLPLPTTAPSSPESLPFASELYEIVNSRTNKRDEYTGLLLPAIDYNGIEQTLNQWQDFFLDARRGTKHLATAITAGLRGEKLLPAILDDCRAWMFARPNLWPKPQETTPPLFTVFKPNTTSVMPLLGQLPNELLLPILADLSLTTVLALASTCRSLRTMILQPAFFDRVIKESIVRGSLRWILPVETEEGEQKDAYDTLRLWIPEEHRPQPYPEPDYTDDEEQEEETEEDGERDEDHPAEEAQLLQEEPQPKPAPLMQSLIFLPHFPALAFIAACWSSDSMMNRKRLWGQVRQFEGLWQEYRLHGWQVNRFYPAEEGRGS